MTHSIVCDGDKWTAFLFLHSIKSLNVNPQTRWQLMVKCITAELKNEMLFMQA